MFSPSSSDAMFARRPLVLRRVGRAAAVFVLLGLSVALIAWLTLQWGILPRIDEWRPQIERRASAALGLQVRIGSIKVHSGGWVPAFDLRDVQLLDNEGRPALALAQVRVALAPQSLLALELRLAQLHVEAVQLDVRRDRQGRIHVAGLEMPADAAAADDGAAADWLFTQHEIVVRNGTLRWTDELRAAPALTLTAVDFVLRNGLRRHDLRLDATPPAEWGERFSLRGHFTAPLLERRGAWRLWSGTLFAEAPLADVAELRRHVALPVDLTRGRGTLRAWLELQRGEWREATADAALADVSVRLAPALEPLAVAELRGRFGAQRDGAGIVVSARQLSFTTAEGLVWPAGDLSVAWQQAQPLGRAAPSEAAPVTGGRIDADRLDLALMSAIAARLPLGSVAQRWLGELQPAGLVTGLQLRWSGAFEAPATYSAKGRVGALALAALVPPGGGAGRPGLAGADIEFDASERGGSAKLAMVNGHLHFPGVFETPLLPFERLAATLDWRIVPNPARAGEPALELTARDLQFANADAQGELRADWRTGKGEGFGAGGRWPGVLDLSGRITRARADRVAAYLPLAIPARARHYVERAVQGGTIDGGSFAVKGELWNFPFHTHAREGLFRVTARVRDATLAAIPGVPAGSAEPAWESPWPAFDAVQGELVFDRTSLQLKDLQARLWGVQLRGVQARIDDLVQEPLLRIEGAARGPAADLLRYVEATPVGRWLGGGLEEMSATGVADLRLALAIPLHDAARTTVRGSVTLAGNDVRVRPELPLLANARGRIDFTHNGFTLAQASARILGGEASFEGGTRPDGSLRFSGQGVASADGLRRTPELGALAAWAPLLRGQAAYRMTLGIVKGWPEVGVTSDLVGLESDLPAPLHKAAATPWPLRYQTTLVPDSLKPGQTVRDQLRFDLANHIQLRLQRDLSGETPRVVAGGLGVFEPAPTPASGLQARLNLASIDADAWSRALGRLPVGSGVDALPAGQVTLRAAEIVVAGRRLTRVVADLSHNTAATDAPWRAQLQADQLSGRVNWRPPRDIADPGRVTARLARLALARSEAVEVEQLLDSAPPRVPALDIVVDQFELHGRALGRLEVQALNRPSETRPGAREWRLDKLDLDLPEARLQASGLWAPAAAGAARRMELEFGLDLADSGALATRLGQAGALRGGKGRVQGRLSWAGSPLAPEVASLDGQLNVALEAGQFLRADPGVARLLGVLSLQSLPRRLLLDFRDVFQEGFSFDSVQGDVTLVHGRASTDNLLMRGVQAVVLMKGTADLQRETQDLRVLVVPEVSAAAASLAVAAINPAIALGTFVAQLLLSEPLRAAGTREFHITGPWAEPQVERVERTAATVPPAPTPAPEGRKKEGPG